jgi:hypothetical protein
LTWDSQLTRSTRCAACMKARPRACDGDKTAPRPSRWKGAAFETRCRPPVPALSSRCSVDPRRRAIPIRLLAHQTAPDTKSALALTTSTAHDDGLRPTRAGTKLNTFASEFSLPINGVRQSQLQTPPGRNLHRHRNAQTVARQLEGQLQIQGERPTHRSSRPLPLP